MLSSSQNATDNLTMQTVKGETDMTAMTILTLTGMNY